LSRVHSSWGGEHGGVSVDEAEALKVNTLTELLTFLDEICTGAIADKLDEAATLDLVEMIRLNAMRPLDCYAQDSRTELVPSEIASAARMQRRVEESREWSVLNLVYEILLKLVSGDVCSMDVKKRCLSESFCKDFLQLFRSRDPREREYVKTIAHCMYSKFVSHRSVMRLGLADAFLEYVYVSKQHAGIAEMLEVFGSVASGFAVPIKSEHRLMLTRCLLPLHSPKGSELYQEQLSFVLLQYVTKDPELVVPVVLSLLKYWPKRNAAKQILFMGELGELAGFMQPRHFGAVRGPLVRQLCDCIQGPHFQVAEYAMGLLNNNYLYSMIFENPKHAPVVLPPLVKALRQASNTWNSSVQQISSDILDFVENLNPSYFKQEVLPEKPKQQLEPEPLYPPAAAAAIAAADAEREVEEEGEQENIDPATDPDVSAEEDPAFLLSPVNHVDNEERSRAAEQPNDLLDVTIGGLKLLSLTKQQKTAASSPKKGTHQITSPTSTPDFESKDDFAYREKVGSINQNQLDEPSDDDSEANRERTADDDRNQTDDAVMASESS